MDTGPIIKIFDSLLTAGAAVALTATAFFVMLAGYQYMSAGGSVRAVESATIRSIGWTLAIGRSGSRS